MATLIINTQNINGSKTALTIASGLGFFGLSGFGSSVQVGEYQETTFVTASGGGSSGLQTHNTQFDTLDVSGVLLDGAASIPLKDLGNSSCPININFNDGAGPVSVQSTEAIVFDNNTIANPLVKAVGVTAKAAEVINFQNAVGSGLGDLAWITASGEGVGGAAPTISLQPNPGVSGTNPGPTSQIHDWYLALSASPDTVGDKVSFGLFVKTEFL